MMLPSLNQDLRYALRQLRKSPGFTLTAILTLALGIGALTTVATWTNAVLYSPWPHVAAPRQLRFIDATVLGGDGYSVHYDQYRYVAGQARSYQGSTAFSLTKVNMVATGVPAQAVAVGVVSSNYFQFLGLRPEAGRLFDAASDDRNFGANDEIVLSDRIWREDFSADPGIVGRPVTINRHSFTVIGVAPAEFSGIFGGVAETAWLPLSSLRDLSNDAPADPLQHFGLQVAVRLRPGVADASAAAELHTLAKTFAQQQHDDHYNGWNLNLRDAAHFERGLFGTIGEQLPVLFGASVLLMVLVCVNIATLLGQHAARRRREVAIRTALGATPARIAMQVLTETVLLAAGGGIAGWGVSVIMSRALYVLLPNFGMPLAFNLHTDVRILLFVAAVAMAVTLLCGAYPVRQAMLSSQNEALHAGGASVAGQANRRIGQRVLLGAQLSICFIVLVCCGLLTRTAMNIFHRDIGFNRAHVMTANFDMERSGYDNQHARAFHSELLARLRSMRGVQAATLTSHLPMGDEGSGNTQQFAIPGYVPGKSEDMEVVTDFEGPGFFHTMQIPLVAGRDFADADGPTSPFVAIVNETMAKRYWPNGDALGRNIELGKHLWQIVGIVKEFAYHNPQDTDPTPLLFLPLTQHDYLDDAAVAIRSNATPGTAAAQLRQAFESLDPALPLENVRSLEDVSGEMYQVSRIPAELLGVYALASLLVAMLGLYAVMAYSVIERHREFALRMALGSTRAAVFRLILTGSASIAFFGMIAGVCGAMGVVRLLRSMLFGVAPFDPASYFAAAGLLLMTALLSGLLPAQRAASIEPMQALRSE